MNKIFILLLIIVILLPISVYAQRGCCSHHGGVSYCGNSGYYICNDGTRSPSCRCETIILTDSSNTSSTYSNNTSINSYNSVDDNEEDREEDEEDITFFIIIGGLFILAILCRKRSKPYYGNN